MKNKYKILVFSDTHLGFDYPIKDNTYPKRGEDFFENFQKVLNYAISQSSDLVIHCGDVFYRSKVPQSIINKSYEIILSFAKHNIPLIIVPGNHERSALPKPILLSHKNIHIFSEPTTFTFQKDNQTISIFGFPYMKEIKAQFKAVINKFKFNENHINILAIHHLIEGSKVKNYTFRYAKDVIQKADIPNEIDLVLSGHIHRTQILYKNHSKKNIPIIFPGSIERTSFQELGEEKGFFILEVMKTHQKLHYSYTFKKLPTRNMVEIELFPNWSLSEFLAAIKKLNLNLPPNSIIRFKGHSNNEIHQYLNKEKMYKIINHTFILEFARSLYDG